MRIRKNIMVLDTETIGDFGTPLVHDLGYVIIDKDFNILKSTRHLVENVRNARWLLDTSDFYKGKKELYSKAIEENKVDIVSWCDIMKEFKEDMKKYNVKIVSAYNIAFDYRALNFTNQFFNNGDTYFETLLDKNYFLCIWNLACDTILHTDDFKKWCKDNSKISVNGNFTTSAETCYQYLKNQLDFEEEHTSLEDVLIEKEILENIIKNYKGNLKYGLQYNCWRKVQ